MNYFINVIFANGIHVSLTMYVKLTIKSYVQHAEITDIQCENYIYLHFRGIILQPNKNMATKIYNPAPIVTDIVNSGT